MESLDLARFLPYRLSVLANKVSAQLAREYADRFGLTIPEWRVLAVLGQTTGVSADYVCGKTAMDRVTVSRAVSKLLKKRFIKRSFLTADRRRSSLSMAAAGARVYAQVVPLAKRYESALLAAMDRDSRAMLEQVLTDLQHKADEFEAAGFER